VLLDRALGQHEVGGDLRVALALRDLAQDLQLARRQLGQRRVARAGAARDHRLDDPRVHQRAAVRDRLDRRNQLMTVVHALLEQVRAAVGAVAQQHQPEARLGVLAQHHDPDLGMRRAQLVGDLDALVAVPRRHADVGHDDARVQPLDRGQQRRPILARRHDRDVRLAFEDPLDRLAREEAVVGQHHADRVAPGPALPISDHHRSSSRLTALRQLP